MSFNPNLPMLFVNMSAEELSYRMAVQSFRYGCANTEQYDKFLRMVNMLCIAGDLDKKRRHAYLFATKTKPALDGIKSRYLATGKFGFYHTEHYAMLELIDFYFKFWKGYTWGLYNYCWCEIDAFYQEQNSAAAAA